MSVSASAVDDAIPATAMGPALQYLALEQLQRSPMNPRKHFDVAKLQELADSFAGVGIIEPLVVRPLPPSAQLASVPLYEIVAGERRYRAAKLAPLETVPAIVRELTDAQVLEIMVVENNQRADVNPLEEGDGFARLLNMGYDLEKLAERIGRSKKYIYDRIKLNDLVPTAKQLLLDERLTAGHAILIARLKPEDQSRVIHPLDGGAFQTDTGATAAEEALEEEALDEVLEESDAPLSIGAYLGCKPRSVRELRRWIAHHVRFDVTHAAQAAPLEFGEVAERVAAAASQPGRGKKVIPITFEHTAPQDTKSDERTYGRQAFEFADGEAHEDSWGDGKSTVAKTCEHSVLGLVVAGAEHYGKAFTVCVARDRCLVHWKEVIQQREKNQKLRDSGQAAEAERRESAAEAKQREEHEERARRQARFDKLAQPFVKALVAAAKDVKAPAGPLYARLLKFHQLPPNTKSADLPKALLDQAIQVQFTRHVWHGDEPKMREWAKLLGVDVRAIERRVFPDDAKELKGRPVQTSAPKKPAKKKR